MNESKDFEEIVKKYPDIFCENFFIECKIGWYDLVDNLCSELTVILKEVPKTNEEEQFRCVQCKEKYGSLRVYVENATEKIYDAIEKFEQISRTTCERCGSRSEIFKKGMWLYNMCEECKKMT